MNAIGLGDGTPMANENAIEYGRGNASANASASAGAVGDVHPPGEESSIGHAMARRNETELANGDSIDGDDETDGDRAGSLTCFGFVNENENACAVAAAAEKPLPQADVALHAVH